MTSQRIARTEKWMKIELTNILKVKAKNSNFSEITITDVKLSNDLSYATIKWYIYIQDKEKVKEISSNLEKVKGFCRKELSQISSAYTVPQLRFKYDETINQANQIESILKKLKNEN